MIPIPMNDEARKQWQRLFALEAENERLKLDVGILNGRLIERTEAMGGRQREYLDRARKAESVAREAVSLLEDMAAAFEDTSSASRVVYSERVKSAEIAANMRKRIKPMRDRLNGEPATPTKGGAA